MASSSAQTAGPFHVIGLQFDVFEGIHKVNALFKKEKKNGWHYRARVGWASFTAYVPLTDVYYNTFRSSLSGGAEKQFQPGKKFHFYIAPELTIAADWSTKAQTGESLLISPGVGAGIGMVFQFSEKWQLNLETIPTLFHDHVVYDKTFNQRLGNGGITMDSQGFYLGISYRFSRKKAA